MRKARWILALWLLMGFSGAHAAGTLMTGWVGGFASGSNWMFVQAQFTPITAGMSGMMDLIQFPRVPGSTAPVMHKVMENIKLEGGKAHFELVVTGNKYTFDGTGTNDGAMTNGLLAGTVSYGPGGTNKSSFRLHRVPPLLIVRYAGMYELEPGHFITFKPASFVNCLVSVDSQSGESRLFMPRDEGKFACGPEMMKFDPVETTVEFTTNATQHPTSMEWKSVDGKTLKGKPGVFQEEAASFTNGAVALSGTLIVPPTSAPHPAVVLVADSGTGTRQDLRFVADFFALNGVASLVYDKRGMGESKGDWKEAGFDEAAGDALAAVDWLKRRSDIDDRKIGLWSMDAGAWVASLAASRSTNVAFLIGLAVPGLTPHEQGRAALEERLKAMKLTPGEIQEAGALYDLNSRTARSGTNWSPFETVLSASRDKRWYGRDVVPHSPEDQARWTRIWNFDPKPALEKVSCPTLIIYGELDRVVPADKGATVWETALKKGGDKGVTVIELPMADHGLIDARMGVPGPAFYSGQRSWLRKQLKLVQ